MRVATLVAALAFIGCSGSDPGASSDTSEASAGSPGSPPPPADPVAVEVNWSEVYLAYDRDKNPLAADAKYKGKRLKLIGVKVWQISRTARGKAYLSTMTILPTARFEPEPNFFFYLADEQTAGHVKKDGTYTIEGTCRGWERDGVSRGIPGFDWRVEFTGCRVITD